MIADHKPAIKQVGDALHEAGLSGVIIAVDRSTGDGLMYAFPPMNDDDVAHLLLATLEQMGATVLKLH